MKIIKNNLLLKLTKNVAFLALVSLTAIFTSCKDKDEPIIENNPVISVSSPSEGSSQVSGSTLTLSFKAKSENGIKKILVKFKSATGIEVTKFDTFFAVQPQEFNFSRDYIVGPIGTEAYTIVVTDKNDNIESKSVNTKSTTGFAPEDFGTMFHILGSKSGAYDLVKAEQRLIDDSDNDKDMENTNLAGSFTGEWISKNNSMFVKSTSTAFDYSSGTVHDAKALYLAGSPSKSISAPVEGDIYIAKIRGNDSYVVLKIIANSPTNDECGCTNTGKLTFSLRRGL